MTFQHRAGVRPYTSPYGFAESCVFDKQSLGPFRCDPRPLGEQVPSPPGALLLPKLRSQYAEFLNHGSPDRLGMLYLPTCVGFGTGRMCIARSFSWKPASCASLLAKAFASLSRLRVMPTGFAWSTATPLRPQSVKRVTLAVSVTPSLHIRVQESPPAFHPLRLSASR